MYCSSIHSQSCHCVLLWWGGPTLAQSVWGWQLGPEAARPPHPALPAKPLNHSARYDKVRELLCSCTHGPILIMMLSIHLVNELNCGLLKSNTWGKYGYAHSHKLYHLSILHFKIDYDLTVIWHFIKMFLKKIQNLNTCNKPSSMRISGFPLDKEWST